MYVRVYVLSALRDVDWQWLRSVALLRCAVEEAIMHFICALADIRVDSKASTIAVTYFGNIKQNSGENWVESRLVRLCEDVGLKYARASVILSLVQFAAAHSVTSSFSC